MTLNDGKDGGLGQAVNFGVSNRKERSIDTFSTNVRCLDGISADVMLNLATNVLMRQACPV